MTAEVRIGNVVNSEAVNIYRELAGGLTCVNLLHGSANAIGGQNQVIKLGWGFLPEELIRERFATARDYESRRDPRRRGPDPQHRPPGASPGMIWIAPPE